MQRDPITFIAQLTLPGTNITFLFISASQPYDFEVKNNLNFDEEENARNLKEFFEEKQPILCFSTDLSPKIGQTADLSTRGLVEDDKNKTLSLASGLEETASMLANEKICEILGNKPNAELNDFTRSLGAYLTDLANSCYEQMTMELSNAKVTEGTVLFFNNPLINSLIAVKLIQELKKLDTENPFDFDGAERVCRQNIMEPNGILSLQFALGKVFTGVLSPVEAEFV